MGRIGSRTWGRLDATNVIPTPALALLTPVTLEHQDILGKTIQKIAGEKAGILKKGGMAATLQIHPKASRAIAQVALSRGTNLWICDRDFTFRKRPDGFDWEGPGLRKRFKLPGLPDPQILNAVLAVAGIQVLRSHGIYSGPTSIERSLSVMRWPGRLEIVRKSPLVLLDGAHNPAAARMLFVHLVGRYPKKKWVVLNGFLGDKDYRGVVGILRPLTAFSAVTEPANDRKQDGLKVFRAWARAGVPSGLRRDWKGALALALGKARKEKLPLLITGSLYLVGDCRKALVGLRGLAKI